MVADGAKVANGEIILDSLGGPSRVTGALPGGKRGRTGERSDAQ